MKRSFITVFFGAIALAGLAVDANAHHSVSAYDLTTTKEVSGTVKQFQWTNPHSWIQLMVLDATGKEVEWALECGTPNVNTRLGWKKSDLQAGDKVKAQIHPMRDGSPHGTLVEVTLADGRVLKGPISLIAPEGGAE